MRFRWRNKQLRIQAIRKLCIHYQLLINNDHMIIFILTLNSMEENYCGKSCSSKLFAFKALNYKFRALFFRTSFFTRYQRHL